VSEEERPTLRVLEAPAREALPDTVEAFLARLGGPTLVHLAGRDRSRIRAFSTLLHGNEPSGVRALHRWLRSDAQPAVDMLCFVGAVDAARAAPGFAQRMLHGSRDLNRCFQAPYEGHEGELAEALLRRLRDHACEALIDVHNNTGHNPPYAVATRTDPERLALCGWFAERFVDCNLRLGTLIEATEDDFPGIALECGRAGDPLADAAAFELVSRYFETDRIPWKQERPLQILHEPVRIRLAPGTEVAFADAAQPGADFTVVGDIDRHNFERVAPGTPVGWLRDGSPWPVEAHGADDVDVSQQLFVARDGMLQTRRELVPMMMTTAPSVAQLDCLFYAVRPRNVE